MCKKTANDTQTNFKLYCKSICFLHTGIYPSEHFSSSSQCFKTPYAPHVLQYKNKTSQDFTPAQMTRCVIIINSMVLIGYTILQQGSKDSQEICYIQYVLYSNFTQHSQAYVLESVTACSHQCTQLPTECNHCCHTNLVCYRPLKYSQL